MPKHALFTEPTDPEEFIDNFNRSNGLVANGWNVTYFGVGNPSDSAYVPPTMSISSNQAGPITTYYNGENYYEVMVWRDLETPEVDQTLKLIDSRGVLVFRLSDDNLSAYVLFDDGLWYIQTELHNPSWSGSPLIEFGPEYGFDFVSGDIMRAVLHNDVMDIYRNGTLFHTQTGITENPEATRHGIFAGTSNLGRWDDYRVLYPSIPKRGGQHRLVRELYPTAENTANIFCIGSKVFAYTNKLTHANTVMLDIDCGADVYVSYRSGDVGGGHAFFSTDDERSPDWSLSGDIDAIYPRDAEYNYLGGFVNFTSPIVRLGGQHKFFPTDTLRWDPEPSAQHIVQVNAGSHVIDNVYWDSSRNEYVMDWHKSSSDFNDTELNWDYIDGTNAGTAIYYSVTSQSSGLSEGSHPGDIDQPPQVVRLGKANLPGIVIEQEWHAAGYGVHTPSGAYTTVAFRRNNSTGVISRFLQSNGNTGYAVTLSENILSHWVGGNTGYSLYAVVAVENDHASDAAYDDPHDPIWTLTWFADLPTPVYAGGVKSEVPNPTLTFPAPLNAGDLVIVSCYHQSGTAISITSSGYTSINVKSGGNAGLVAQKKAVGGETSVTLAADGGGFGRAATVVTIISGGVYVLDSVVTDIAANAYPASIPVVTDVDAAQMALAVLIGESGSVSGDYTSVPAPPWTYDSSTQKASGASGKQYITHLHWSSTADNSASPTSTIDKSGDKGISRFVTLKIG